MSKVRDMVSLATGMRTTMTDTGVNNIGIKGGCTIIYVDSMYEVATFAAEFGAPMHVMDWGGGSPLLYVESVLSPDVMVRGIGEMRNITVIEEFIKLHNEGLGLED